MRDPYMEALRELAVSQGWSRHKWKSIRGQMLAKEDPIDKERFLQRLIRKGTKR